jgi:hypothetical protein
MAREPKSRGRARAPRGFVARLRERWPIRLGTIAAVVGLLATVVGLLTGLLTLRDELSGSEDNAPSRSAAGLTVEQYRERVGEVCQLINEAEAASRTGAENLSRRLRRAETVAVVRRGLVSEWRQSALDVKNARNELAALHPPALLRTAHEDTVRLFDRNDGRLRAQRAALAHAASYGDVIAAVNRYSRLPRQADGKRLRLSLRHLGGRECRLVPPGPRPVIAIPR